jgi:short-subunit dehydrogenase
LILVARRTDRLEDLAGELNRTYGVRVYPFARDLSAPAAARELHATIRDAGLLVDIVVNNAGVGEFGPFVTISPERVEEMVRLNVESLTLMCQLFMGDMLDRASGGFINVSSTAAFQAMPGFAVYAAPKPTCKVFPRHWEKS